MFPGHGYFPFLFLQLCLIGLAADLVRETRFVCLVLRQSNTTEKMSRNSKQDCHLLKIWNQGEKGKKKKDIPL